MPQSFDTCAEWMQTPVGLAVVIAAVLLPFVVRPFRRRDISWLGAILLAILFVGLVFGGCVAFHDGQRMFAFS